MEPVERILKLRPWDLLQLQVTLFPFLPVLFGERVVEVMEINENGIKFKEDQLNLPAVGQICENICLYLRVYQISVLELADNPPKEKLDTVLKAFE